MVSPRKYGLPCAWAAAASDLYRLVYDTMPLERAFVENSGLLLAGHSRVAHERLQVRARAPTRRLGVRVAGEGLDVLDGRPEQRDEPGRAPRGLLQIHGGLEDVPKLHFFRERKQRGRTTGALTEGARAVSHAFWLAPSAVGFHPDEGTMGESLE